MIMIVIILYFTSFKQISRFTNKKYKVAICFFGLTRSLKYTMNSIEDNIIKPLKNANIEYDIILHTYNLRHLKLKRSGENNSLNTTEWKLLNPVKYRIDNQDDFDRSYDYNYVKSFGDAWNTNFENTINLIRQFNSLKQVWNLCESMNKDYDCYLFIRPDLKYTKKLNINQVIGASKASNTIYTPLWHKYGGLNDRMALGNYNSMKKYANRLDNVQDYLKSQQRPLHAELFLKFVINKNNIVNKEFNMVGKRVRSNGTIPNLDRKL